MSIETEQPCEGQFGSTDKMKTAYGLCPPCRSGDNCTLEKSAHKSIHHLLTTVAQNWRQPESLLVGRQGDLWKMQVIKTVGWPAVCHSSTHSTFVGNL